MNDPVSRVAKQALHYWRHGLAPGGRLLLLGTLFAGGLGSIAVSVPVQALFCALVALYVVAVLGGHLFRPRVRLSGALPDKVAVGQEVDAEFHVTRTSWLPAYDVGLRFEDLPIELEHLRPGQTAPELVRGQTVRFPVTVRARKRGAYTVPAVQAYSAFPFNVCQAAGTKHPPGAMLVLPRFHPLTSMRIPTGRRYQPGGIALTSDVGESPEYIGSREYRPGDSYRRFDFRSWARLGQPGVKEFQEEYYCRLALVVDTFVARGRRKGRDGFPELEAAVSLTAAVADALSRGEYIIDIFAAGPELYVFRAGRHIAHLDNILEILACVEECRSNPFELIAPAITAELSNVTTAICVMLDWDDARARFVRAAAEAGCATKVLIVRDGPTSTPFEAAEDWAGPISRFTPEAVESGGIEEL